LGILVVDDSRDSCALLKRLLNNAGHSDVLVANSASEAFSILGLDPEKKDAGKGIELLLMDVMMPDMNGIEACKKLRACGRFDDIPVIMVTANDEADSLAAAFKAGASDYIRKPVNSMELFSRVNSALELKTERDRRKAREKDLVDALEELRKANEILKHLSAIDGLTGISNRRNFDDFLEKEWRRSMRTSSPISLIMVDIDHFKAYNDSYGHQEGDDCLKKVANIIRKNIHRPADLAARYGGEEFVIVLPDTHSSQAETIAGNLRACVEEAAIPHTASGISSRVTISLGVATLAPTQEAGYFELIKLADMALYDAKRVGRNRLVIAAPGGSPE
jgi:diguanylate cyclase (GGDEF)-like protein